jgi:acyl carrier protein
MNASHRSASARGDELRKDIITLVANILKLPNEKIDPKANMFTELGVDSLLGVEIFAALDKKYDLNVPESKLRDINTVNDLVKLVSDLRAKR